MVRIWRLFLCLILGHRWEYEAIIKRGWQERLCMAA